ncbi:MAG: hypothetical protein RL232_180 [Actinomycetota bacterium]
MSSPLALDVADLSKKYGDRMALSHANFEVPMGSICGFVGPNGSGKTTTIRMLLGLISPTTGSGHVLGESITNVGAMIEGPAFYPALTGAQNLTVLAKLGGFDTNTIQGLLDLVDLGDRGNSKYKTYSLGMKQRLGIAAALLPKPKLLILDEPTNGLDPAGIQEVRALLRKLADNGTTVFVSSHLLSEIEMISDHLVMLRLGKVIFSGKTSELLAKQQPVIVAKPENRGDLEKLVKIAEAGGHSAKIIDESVHVTGTSDFSAKLNKAAFEAGITLESLTPVRASLEDTFFEMTGE